jgi:predicted nucleic acid-binding protein
VQEPGTGTNSMKDKVFLDTNIFIYSVDSSPDQKRKADVARELIKRQIRGGTGVISMQVRQEFYQVSTQKIRVPLSMEDALEYLARHTITSQQSHFRKGD